MMSDTQTFPLSTRQALINKAKSLSLLPNNILQSVGPIELVRHSLLLRFLEFILPIDPFCGITLMSDVA